MKTKPIPIRNSLYKVNKSKSFAFRLLLILFVLIIVSNANAKASDNGNGKKFNTYQQLNASYIIGGQIFNDNFIYNPGFSLDLSTGVFVNKNIGLGLGTAYKALENESFIPIYGEIIGYKNKKNTSFINMKLGYSIGWNDAEIKDDSYEFKGGVFLSVGMGRKIQFNNNYSVLLHWSYQHQFAKMEYEIFSNQGYQEVLNYDMIVVSIGIIKETR